MKRTLIVGALCCAGVVAGADEVLLKTGGRVTGEIVEQTDRAVVVDIGAGLVTLPRSTIKQIKGGQALIQTYRSRAEQLVPGDVEGWLKLAQWASDADLRTQAREAYQHVLRTDPGNALAHTALGDVLLGGRWVSAEESYRAQGLVSFEGAWVTPEQQQATLAQRASDDAARLRREEDAARLREIEARARLAEAEARRSPNSNAGDSGGGIPIYGYGGGGPCVVDSPYCIDRSHRSRPHPAATPPPQVVRTPPPSDTRTSGSKPPTATPHLGLGKRPSAPSDPGARNNSGS